MSIDLTPILQAVITLAAALITYRLISVLRRNRHCADLFKFIAAHSVIEYYIGINKHAFVV